MWKANFNSAQLKTQNKAARAFALWVVAITICATVHTEKLPELKSKQDEAHKAADLFNKNKQKMERLQVELTTEADSLQEQANELQSLHNQIKEISAAKIVIN